VEGDHCDLTQRAIAATSAKLPVAIAGCPSGQRFTGNGDLEIPFLQCPTDAVEPSVVDAQGFAAPFQFQHFAVHGIGKLFLVLWEADADVCFGRILNLVRRGDDEGINLRSLDILAEPPHTRIMKKPVVVFGHTVRASRRSVAIWTVLTVLLSATRGRAADVPTLLVLPLEMVDTSDEPHSKTHEDRLATLTGYLSQQLGASGLYAIIDPSPIGTAIEKARASQPLDNCNGCERDLARLVHADRVLIGEVRKVSTLIGSLRLSIVDVATGQSVFGRELGFRGDTDEAWQHAVRFFVRDLAETAPQQR
jgi:hypothetical protein